MKKIINLFFTRMVITILLILLQVLVLAFVAWNLNEYVIYFHRAFYVISLFVLVYIINKKESPSYKLPWVFLIFIFPIIGVPLYLVYASEYINEDKYNKLNDEGILSKNDNLILDKIKEDDKIGHSQISYLVNKCFSKPYINTSVKYFPMGEDVYKSMLSDLENANKFIFIEYFIIEEGKMWNSILKVLKKKVKEGLDVRVMYDDIGCIKTLPNKYYKKLEKCGIKCTVFNEFKPVLSLGHNNRNHRKILSIDGNIAYTGGINLADEYINEIERFGVWKDTAVRLEGDAAEKLTSMFLSTWDYFSKTSSDLNEYKCNVHNKSDGVIIPFGDSPVDSELVGQSVYINMINLSTEYVYINTPYLIVSHELLEALRLAAKRGVDVRLTTPHIPDKWYVHLMTRSNYEYLTEAGVKIHEYEPGFIHAKSFVSDDKYAVIGTINLDYRSLVHHFECGVYIYNSSVIKDMKDDYVKTLKKCVIITKSELNNIPIYKKLFRNILEFFAPLL